MAVNLPAPDPSALLAIKGGRLGVTEAGVRKANRRDLLLMTLSAGSRVAGVFTRNRFFAAPVLVAKANLQGGAIRPLAANTGGANRGNGVHRLTTATLT